MRFRLLSAGAVVVYIGAVVFGEVRDAQTAALDKCAPGCSMGGLDPSHVEIAAVLLLVGVAALLTMPVVTMARSRFESDAGNQGSDLPPERR